MRVMGEVMSAQEFPQTRSRLFLVYCVMDVFIRQIAGQKNPTNTANTPSDAFGSIIPINAMPQL